MKKKYNYNERYAHCHKLYGDSSISSRSYNPYIKGKDGQTVTIIADNFITEAGSDGEFFGVSIVEFSDGNKAYVSSSELS